MTHKTYNMNAQAHGKPQKTKDSKDCMQCCMLHAHIRPHVLTKRTRFRFVPHAQLSCDVIGNLVGQLPLCLRLAVNGTARTAGKASDKQPLITDIYIYICIYIIYCILYTVYCILLIWWEMSDKTNPVNSKQLTLSNSWKSEFQDGQSISQ